MVRLLVLASLLGLILAPSSAHALSTTATFGLQDAPHCALPPELPWCPLGHEDNGTSDLGDDTLHPSTVIDYLTVDVDPGVPGVQPIRFRFGDDQSFSHPVFRTLEQVFEDTHGRLPPAVQDIVRYHDHDTWFYVCVPPLLPPEMLYPCRPLPLPLYLSDFIERDRIYPVPRLGNDTAGTEEIIHILGWFLATCPPEVRHQAPVVCHLTNRTSHEAADTLARLLPNIIYHQGIDDVDLDVDSDDPGSPPVSIRPAQGSRGEPGPLGSPSLPLPLFPDDPPPPPHIPLATRPTANEPAAAAEPLVHDPQQSRSATVPLPAESWAPALAAAAGLSLTLLAVALYRRLRAANLLKHPHRRALLDLVAQRPGVTVGDAASELGLSYKTAQHHAELLVEHHHLVVQRLGRMRKLFLASGGFSVRERAAVVALQRPAAQRLWTLLQQRGAMPRGELEAASGLSRTAAYEGLRALRDHGWVEVEGSGRGAVVVPSAVAHGTLPSLVVEAS